MGLKEDESKICLINVYFGKLPNYFNLWLNSCRHNPSIDFLLFIDDKTNYDYPTNVHVHYSNLLEMKKYFQKCFDFEITLDTEYKLCDYKPLYGQIFSDYLKEYDFWGHCDLDVVFGNIRKFVTEDILNKYDKIFPCGHFTLYRNETRINENYKEILDENGAQLYRNVFSNNKSYYFDEVAGIIKLYDNIKYKIYSDNTYIADIKINYNNFIPVNTKEKNKHIFYWHINENNVSELIAYYKDSSNEINKKEFMYIHLQKRKMNTDELTDINEFYIIPNKFINTNLKNYDNFFKKYTYRKTIHRKEYIKLKINRFINRIKRKVVRHE